MRAEGSIKKQLNPRGILLLLKIFCLHTVNALYAIKPNAGLTKTFACYKMLFVVLPERHFTVKLNTFLARCCQIVDESAQLVSDWSDQHSRYYRKTWVSNQASSETSHQLPQSQEILCVFFIRRSIDSKCSC